MSEIHQKKSLRYIGEACGGTLTFEQPYSDYDDLSKDQGKHIPLVGTAKCIFCVGVYFKISATQAFCAHIQAYRDPRTSECSAYVSPEEGAKMRRTVLRKLQAEAAEQDWNPTKVDKKSVILVCPQPDRYTNRADDANAKLEYKQVKLAGWYVAEAIKQFLELPDEEPVEHQCQGFVVHHGTGHERMLPVMKREKDSDGFVQFIKAPEVEEYEKVGVFQSRDWDINAAELP